MMKKKYSRYRVTLLKLITGSHVDPDTLEMND